ncbi:MAG: DUF1730 domain-containing protein [Spirochaetia bacterium]|nr:DUF1730 domain-containing protein [Spirochaetia bacterium]
MDNIAEENTFTQQDIHQIRQQALELGFSNVKFISAVDPDKSWQNKYREYLKKGFHAGMKYLENVQSRFSVKKIYQPVQTIAVFSLPYLYNNKKSNEPVETRKYNVAKYALGRDYHLVVREKLEIINSISGIKAGRIVCDTTPLPERYYGALSGLGFIGKNAMLIDPRLGSYFFLAFILFEQSLSTLYVNKWTDLPEIKKEGIYDYQTNIDKFCGSCEKCVKACPGGALDGSGYLNSQRCYSYWSIENRLEIIQADFKKMTSVFGCDICQDVCPYNVKPLTTNADDFKVSEISLNVMNADFENLSLKETAYERTGIKGLKRNLQFIAKEK